MVVCVTDSGVVVVLLVRGVTGKIGVWSEREKVTEPK